MSETQATQPGTKTYSGSCHCGAVQFDVEADLSGPVMTCNCSMCNRAGVMLTFVQPEKFTLKQGADAQTNYHFNHHAIDHLFCKTCGIKSYATGKKPDGSSMVAVNARCLEGVDVDGLEVKKVNGKAS